MEVTEQKICRKVLSSLKRIYNVLWLAIALFKVLDDLLIQYFQAPRHSGVEQSKAAGGPGAELIRLDIEASTDLGLIGFDLVLNKTLGTQGDVGRYRLKEINLDRAGQDQAPKQVDRSPAHGFV